MTLVAYKAIAALLILLVSIATIVYPLKRRSAIAHTEPLELGEAFASGIFLGVAFFHMLPDAIKSFAAIYGSITYPIPEAISVAGFLLLLFLERLTLANSRTSIPYILAIILVIHGLTEGAALGIGTTLSETLIIFVAIMAHKGSESFALCVTMLKYKLPVRHILLMGALFALMTPLGILLGSAAGTNELAEAVFNAFAAGTFLYISTLHHIRFHPHTEEKQGMLEFAFLVLGLLTMALIALWT